MSLPTDCTNPVSTFILAHLHIDRSVTRNEGVLKNPRSTSHDIFYKPHEMHNFWNSMNNIERFNHWNQNYASVSPHENRIPSRQNSQSKIGAKTGLGVAAGGWGGRSQASSLSATRNGESSNFGIWGKNTNQGNGNRESSPAFGGGQKVRAIKEDDEVRSNVSGSDLRSNLGRKSVARFTYSQIQLGADES